MTSIYIKAFDLAILFRSNAVPYSWLHKNSLSRIPEAEVNIVGVTHPEHSAGLWKPWRMVFGGVVKSEDSGEDRVVLAKSEILFH